jgi:AcrR family transcriptional regulator
VNSAAISYYFGSRDELIALVMKKTLDNAFDFDDFTYPKDAHYKSVLKEILDHWQKGALGYPGITYAHFEGIINSNAGNEITLRRINEFIDNTYKILVSHGLKDDPLNYKRLKLVFSAFISTILIPGAAYPQGCSDQTQVLVDML